MRIKVSLRIKVSFENYRLLDLPCASIRRSFLRIKVSFENDRLFHTVYRALLVCIQIPLVAGEARLDDIDERGRLGVVEGLGFTG